MIQTTGGRVEVSAPFEVKDCRNFINSLERLRIDKQILEFFGSHTSSEARVVPPNVRSPRSPTLPDSPTLRLPDSPHASLATLTSVDLITASASSPRLRRSASTASRVMMAVSD